MKEARGKMCSSRLPDARVETPPEMTKAQGRFGVFRAAPVAPYSNEYYFFLLFLYCNQKGKENGEIQSHNG